LVLAGSDCSSNKPEPNGDPTNTAQNGTSEPDGAQTTCGGFLGGADPDQLEAVTQLLQSHGNAEPSEADLQLARVALTVFCNSGPEAEDLIEQVFPWAEAVLRGENPYRKVVPVGPFATSPMAEMINIPDKEPLGGTPQGGIQLGTDLMPGGPVPDDVVRVDVIYDYVCPICVVMDEQMGETLRQAAQEGQISLVMHPVAYLDHFTTTDYSSRATNAAAVVASLAPDRFQAFEASLWVNQPPEGTIGLTDDELMEIAAGLNIGEEVYSQFTDQPYAEWVREATISMISMQGFPGTPLVLMTYNDQTWSFNWEEGDLAEAIEIVKAGL